MSYLYLWRRYLKISLSSNENISLTIFGESSNFWYPISAGDVEKSTEALRAHVSQIENPDEAIKWMKKRRADLGNQIGAEFAEGFRRFNLR